MVTAKQVARGIAAYVDSEILPKMGNGFGKYGVGVLAAIMMKKGESAMDRLFEDKKLQALGITSAEGLDIDLLREAMIERFPAEGLRIDAEQINAMIAGFLGSAAPLFNTRLSGGMTFRREDVEKLYNYVRG